MEIKKDVAITELIQMLEHTDDLYKASALEKAINALTQPEIIYCPECKYYCAPVCTFHSCLPMTSRSGWCYHAIRGKYEGEIPTVERRTEMAKGLTGKEVEKLMNVLEKGRKEFSDIKLKAREEGDTNMQERYYGIELAYTTFLIALKEMVD